MEHFKKRTFLVSKKQVPSYSEPLQCKDHLVSNESFSLVYDDTRKLLVTTPQPKAEDLSEYYESDAYISHTDSNKGIIPFLYQQVKRYSLKSKMRLIHSLQKKGKHILDVGAGTGDFLLQAKTMGWQIDGVEVNETARTLALEKGIALKETLEQIEHDTYDVITLWHVLEHIPNLDETLQQIEKALAPGGTLLIAVPNYKSFDAEHYKSNWAAYDVPRHLWHFSKNSMALLFPSSVQLIKIKPMWFDAFYVSLLSEKYKTGKDFSLKALSIGCWSNIKGMYTKEYSSHIYCFKSSD